MTQLAKALTIRRADGEPGLIQQRASRDEAVLPGVQVDFSFRLDEKGSAGLCGNIGIAARDQVE
jgi:hypothetical protein